MSTPEPNPPAPAAQPAGTGPADLSDDPDFAAIACPHCEHHPCTVLSIFGGGASEVLFQCRSCKSCFHWVKWQGKLPFDPGAP